MAKRAKTKSAGRSNQKRRTRKALLEAATRLTRKGVKPSLDEVAEEALVSRATAYRYFPNIDALLLEAALDVAIPTPDDVFRDDLSHDPVARVLRADEALDKMIDANEPTLRLMLASALQAGLRDDIDGALPARQNRRTPLIEAALEPAKKEFTPASRTILSQALALILGSESMIVCKDVLQLSDAETRKMKRWAIRALIEAARRPTGT